MEITHIFPCINICQFPKKLFEHEAGRRRVQTSSEGPGKCYCKETNMSQNIKFNVSTECSSSVGRALDWGLKGC